MAEREGFEPPIPLRVCLISSQVHSTGLCHLSVLFCRLPRRQRIILLPHSAFSGSRPRQPTTSAAFPGSMPATTSLPNAGGSKTAARGRHQPIQQGRQAPDEGWTSLALRDRETVFTRTMFSILLRCLCRASPAVTCCLPDWFSPLPPWQVAPPAPAPRPCSRKKCLGARRPPFPPSRRENNCSSISDGSSPSAMRRSREGSGIRIRPERLCQDRRLQSSPRPASTTPSGGRSICRTTGPWNCLSSTMTLVAMTTR